MHLDFNEVIYVSKNSYTYIIKMESSKDDVHIQSIDKMIKKSRNNIDLLKENPGKKQRITNKKSPEKETKPGKVKKTTKRVKIVKVAPRIVIE